MDAPYQNIANGLADLEAMEFNVVNNTIVKDINLELLSKKLEESRNNKYVIDGIVINDIQSSLFILPLLIIKLIGLGCQSRRQNEGRLYKIIKDRNLQGSVEL